MQLEAKTVIIMRGIPGSGKSHRANYLCEQARLNLLCWEVCSADNFFIDGSGNYNWNPRLIGKAHEWCRVAFVKSLQDGIEIVIVDNTNTTIKEMEFYVDWALSYGYNIKFIEPDTSWKFDASECAKKNKHNVPLECIQRMLDRYVHNVTLEDFPCTKPETK